MALFTDPVLLRRHLEEALAQQLRLSVIQTQAELGSSAISPVDTGRLRSSWFASIGTPSDAVAPEGANAPNTDAQALRLRYTDQVHLTNSLPYAEAIALGINMPPSWGGVHRVVSQDPTWFYRFRDDRMPKIADAAGRLTKQEFDL